MVPQNSLYGELRINGFTAILRIVVEVENRNNNSVNGS